MIPNNCHQSITGKEAFEIFSKICFNPIEQIFLPYSHENEDGSYGKSFYRGSVGEDLLLSKVEFTRCLNPDNPNSRYGEGKYFDTYNHLRKLSEAAGDGVFWIPGKPGWCPLTEKFTWSDIVRYEIDDKPLEEQLAIVDWFIWLGLSPCAVVHTGGKSAHVYFKLTEPLRKQDYTYLNGLFVPLIGADPKPAANVVNQMRIPGFYRKSKEAEQTLLYHNEAAVYTFDEMTDLLFTAALEKQIDLTPIKEQPQAYVNYDADFEPTNYLEKYGEDKLTRLIGEVLGILPERIPKTGTYEQYRIIATAIKNMVGEEKAISLLTEHSPTGTNWRQVIGSSNGKYGLPKLKEAVSTLIGYDWDLPDYIQAKSQQSSKKSKKSLTDLGFPKWKQLELSEYLIEKYKGRLVFNGETKEWYCYGTDIDGIWQKKDSLEVNQLITLELDYLRSQIEEANHDIREENAKIKEYNRNLLPGEDKKDEIEELEVPGYTSRLIKGINELMSFKLLTPKMATNSKKGFLPLRNGVLQVVQGKLLPHDPKNYFTWCLPYDYNPLAKCDFIKQWLLEMMGGDESLVELIRAYLHGIVTGRSDWQRFLELIGPGGTGKSTLIRLAIALVGFDNCHITTLSKLETSRFETANIKDKRLVLITDAEQYTGGVTTLKALTGQDRLPYEVKMKQGTGGFTPECLVIVAGNENIKTGDYTSGLERRRITVGMMNQIKPKYQLNLIDYSDDGTISGEFAPFIPGLLNWVLEMDSFEATQLVKDSQNLCPGLVKQKLQTLIENNPIAAWLNDNIFYDPNVKTKMGLAQRSKEEGEVFIGSSRLLYANYKTHCEGSGTNGLSLNRFVPLLLDFCNHQMNLTAVERQKDNTGAYIVGLGIREHHDDSPRLVESIFTQSSETLVGEELQPLSATTSTPLTSETLVGEELQPLSATISTPLTSETLVGEELQPPVRTVTAGVRTETLVGEEREDYEDFLEVSEKNNSFDECMKNEKSIIHQNEDPKTKPLNKSSLPSPSSPVRVTSPHQVLTSPHHETNKPELMSQNSDLTQSTKSFKPGDRVKILTDALGKHLQGAIATVKDFIEDDAFCWLRVNGELSGCSIDFLEPLSS